MVLPLLVMFRMYSWTSVWMEKGSEGSRGVWIPAPVSGHEGKLFAGMTGGCAGMTGGLFGLGGVGRGSRVGIGLVG